MSLDNKYRPRPRLRLERILDTYKKTSSTYPFSTYPSSTYPSSLILSGISILTLRDWAGNYCPVRLLWPLGAANFLRIKKIKSLEITQESVRQVLHTYRIVRL
ncbi:hypothetical protein RRG08_063149 [Elysia crispata]|uniref:Uncharacterized protein n=1 Tax=Elysia crispata TaxID=231223 RepID=A0AAE0ZDX8_9GAST|nr:hypothetical protein RRG08_063149 [Elysia crispata]